MWNAGLAELLLHSVQPEDMTGAGTMLRTDRRKQDDMGTFVDLHRFQQIGLDWRAGGQQIGCIGQGRAIT